MPSRCQRREIAADFNLAEDIVIDQGAAGEEVRALDYTVAHSLYVIETAQHAVHRIHQKIHHELHPHLMVGDGPELGVWLLTGRLVGKLSFGKTDFFNHSLGKKIIDVVALHVKELVLDGRTAAIDY